MLSIHSTCLTACFFPLFFVHSGLFHSHESLHEMADAIPPPPQPFRTNMICSVSYGHIGWCLTINKYIADPNPGYSTFHLLLK